MAVVTAGASQADGPRSSACTARVGVTGLLASHTRSGTTLEPLAPRNQTSVGVNRFRRVYWLTSSPWGGLEMRHWPSAVLE